ncbi:cytochrome C [Azohydromonas aeria]|uniref:cytochrome C n=1 Tax=Azohydromonas aeria TaxID=2590212 RepID=UPI0012F71081|nr:cytochrome C [Azohydromonas aeria]
MHRTSFSLSCAALAGALLAGTAPAHGADGAPGSPPSVARPEPNDRISRGFAIVPEGVTLNLKGRDRTLVGLGSYLVNAVGGCNDCHARPAYAPGGNPFNGEPERIDAEAYLRGGRQFGPFTSPNLRPDARGNPAGLRLWQFIRTIRTGHSPNDAPGQILQVMPWPVYSHMVERDLRAIYEYLRSLPSAPDNPNPGP